MIKGGWGWRLSLGGAMVPALIIIVGSIVLPETPTSMIERGRKEEAGMKLKRIRGVDNIDEEFYDLVMASEASQKIGFEGKASLMSVVIKGYVNIVATYVLIYGVDKWGRRFIFLEGGAQMLICQISRPKYRRLYEHDFHANCRPIILSNALPLEVWALPLLCFLGSRDDDIHICILA
ncbi:hypothetical protein L6452_01534 [Arctium lappa]|uniref:Uncharacterized protein n=1 Tax=Arctium lappa TaxID=4217 RepID=A0ACB9FGX1_ARCLA|nr:hypothetical protein L6452_01534 [Arctium lappa]